MKEKPQRIKIGVVGPCSAGKTTLVKNLKQIGIQAKHIAQEHSYAPTMWERLSHPDLLIFLDVTYNQAQIRRTLNWNEQEYQTQHKRLAHARKYADLYIDTTDLTPEEVLQNVLAFLKPYGLPHAP